MQGQGDQDEEVYEYRSIVAMLPELSPKTTRRDMPIALSPFLSRLMSFYLVKIARRDVDRGLPST